MGADNSAAVTAIREIVRYACASSTDTSMEDFAAALREVASEMDPPRGVAWFVWSPDVQALVPWKPARGNE